MYSFQSDISLMRFFGRIKAALANAFAVNHNLDSPFSLMSGHTQKTGFTGFCCYAHILQVTAPRYFSKIIESIVLLISVFVVNMTGRKRSGFIQPCETMREHFSIVNSDGPIACVCWTARKFADKIRSAIVSLPDKKPCVWVVLKDSAKMVSGNHEFDFTIRMAR